jgi:hypothetical protein
MKVAANKFWFTVCNSQIEDNVFITVPRSVCGISKPQVQMKISYVFNKKKKRQKEMQ